MTEHKALEVSVDGVAVRLCVPPVGGGFVATLGNVPRTHMRAFVLASDRNEQRRWQLPDAGPDVPISFRMVDAADALGSPPDEVRAIHPDMHDEAKRAARELTEAVEDTMKARRDLYRANQALKEGLRILALVQPHLRDDTEGARQAASLVAQMLDDSGGVGR